MNLGEAAEEGSTTDDTSQRINTALAGYSRENVDEDMRE